MLNTIPLFGGSMVLWYMALVWTLVWKGLALWKAARQGQPYWFVALLIINTIGILEILYLFVFSKKEWKFMKDRGGHHDHGHARDHEHKEHDHKEEGK